MKIEVKILDKITLIELFPGVVNMETNKLITPNAFNKATMVISHNGCNVESNVINYFKNFIKNQIS